MMRCGPAILVLLLLALVWPARAQTDSTADPLASAMLQALAALDVPADAASLVVRDLATGETLVSHLPDVPRNPASVMKAVTTFAALDQLGPGYRWTTEALIDTKPDAQGRVDTLYVRGNGNPYWVADDFNEFVRAVYARGVLDISGDLVLDRSYYETLGGDRAAFDDKEHRVYNVLPDPLSMNFGALSL
ncbi:MAG: D-alanyl-D-alanine carboxypeptidase [Gammaproteobacteria bacterium]